ncbi:MAG: hypothetical protein HY246_02145, partial [Proteobacteria bacterium]|nr:hypothetical protein [Pseudomonadota bacterium]
MFQVNASCAAIALQSFPSSLGRVAALLIFAMSHRQDVRILVSGRDIAFGLSPLRSWLSGRHLPLKQSKRESCLRDIPAKRTIHIIGSTLRLIAASRGSKQMHTVEDFAGMRRLVIRLLAGCLLCAAFLVAALANGNSVSTEYHAP